MQLNYKIVITGGSGRFGSILKKKYKSNKLFYPNKSKLNILSIRSNFILPIFFIYYTQNKK